MDCPVDVGGMGAHIEVADVLGFPLCVGEPRDVLELVWERMLSREPAHVVTLNPEMIMASRNCSASRELLAGADLMVADGQGVVWAARIAGRTDVHRYPGVDLVKDLMARMAGRRMRVYLLGGEPGIAARAAEVLAAELPGLEIAGTQHGYYAGEQEEKIVAEVKAGQPDLLLVGLGSPKQEQFIFEHRKELGVPVMVGVGGAMEVFSGRRRRAPGWVSRIGMEWCFRALVDVSRLKRLGILPRFVFMVLANAIRRVE